MFSKEFVPQVTDAAHHVDAGSLAVRRPAQPESDEHGRHTQEPYAKRHPHPRSACPPHDAAHQQERNHSDGEAIECDPPVTGAAAKAR
jgi:hypothetical protein